MRWSWVSTHSAELASGLLWCDFPKVPEEIMAPCSPAALSEVKVSLEDVSAGFWWPWNQKRIGSLGYRCPSLAPTR